MGARARQRIPDKVVWLDASNVEDYDPRTWGKDVPKQVLGRMTPTRIKAIRQLYHSGEFTQAKLAEMFDTTGANICLIVQRKTWKWL